MTKSKANRLLILIDESLPGIVVALLILGFVCINGSKLKYENGANVAQETTWRK